MKLFFITFLIFNLYSLNLFADDVADDNNNYDAIDLDPDSDLQDQKKITLGEVDQNNLANVAVLQGLNKITAKTSEFEVKIGQEVEFGRLTIKAYSCWKSPPDQRPESKILLEIYETDADNVKNRIFYGWMFASSPSTSGLEHPIYDITALNCIFK